MKSKWRTGKIFLSLILTLTILVMQGCKQKKTAKNNSVAENSLIPIMPSANTTDYDTMSQSFLTNQDIPSEIPQAELQTPELQEQQEQIPDIPLQNQQLQQAPPKIQPKRKLKRKRIKKAKTTLVQTDKELDFEVENLTGKTLYITCFTWLRKRDFGNWRWDKTSVQKIDPNQAITINVDTIPDPQDRNFVFGYLAVLENKKDAEDATIELLPDSKKLDLDQLIKLKGKKVTIGIEKYGTKGELFEYDFVDVDKVTHKKVIPELDFAVENKTGKPILVTCFVYQKKAKGTWVASLEDKDDMAVWRFDKTPLIKIMPDQIGIVDVDTIVTKRDRSYIRGYLAVFNEDEEDLAKNAIYELLELKRKLHLGELRRLKNKKIIITVEKYGIIEDFIDYVIKPAHHIEFTKIHENR